MKKKTLTLRLLALPGIVALFCYSANAQQIPKLSSNTNAPATVFLDFDGHTVKGTAWNWEGVIRAQASGLSTTLITEMFNRIAEDFRIFNINITTDSTYFKKAPVGKRMRVIVTPTSSWYGKAAGVSFVNSFSWGDDTPAWVFTTSLEGNPKYLAEAASHEIGHTLGLQHQSLYDNKCKLITEYSEGKGTGEIAWAPIMGVGYYRNFSLWTIGQTIEGCDVTQNDISVISKGLNNIGLRADDHGNNRQAATPVIFSGTNFHTTGIINNAADRDYFKMNISKASKVKATIVPYNVGKNNAGANVDLFLLLINNWGDTIGRYNPKTVLNAGLDTTLSGGIYFLVADGTSNQYVSDYGSVGLYTLSGSVDNPGAKPVVLLRGDVHDNYNIVSWQIEEGTVPRVTYLEYSIDRKKYTSIPVVNNSFVHRTPGKRDIHYRVKMILPDETVSYSEEITLSNAIQNVLPLSNIITTSFVQVKSNGEYAYQLMDETGRLLGKGTLITGVNNVPVRTLHKGVLILKAFNKNEQLHFRLIKQ
ncbi:MAG: hypothetical protein JNK79_12070 [Chitinophagaceae bacterium]|nr:hypothetical protein [Chitinophagaceae bacterium]